MVPKAKDGPLIGCPSASLGPANAMATVTHKCLTVLPTAVFVLFAAAAGARVVPADFRSATDGLGFGHRIGGFLDHVAGFFIVGLGCLWRRAAKGLGSAVDGGGRQVAPEAVEG